jgi:ankyrin repeat protein
MKLRYLALGALGLTLLGLGALWTLGHLMPGIAQRGAQRSSPLTAAAMEPTTDGLRHELEVHPLAAPGDPRGEQALIWAARTGRGESIAFLAHAGVPVSFRDTGPNGWQPLHHAVHKNEVEGVRALIAAGAEVDGTNPDGLTPLMLAAAQGEGEIVAVLLDAGADPRREQPGGQNALGYALMGGDLLTVQELLVRAPDLRQPRGLKTGLSRLVLRLRGRTEILRLVDERPAPESEARR